MDESQTSAVALTSSELQPRCLLTLQVGSHCCDFRLNLSKLTSAFPIQIVPSLYSR